MGSRQSINVLFCVAAGPRLGFGHLVRASVLANEMGVVRHVALRATGETRRTARALGWHVHHSDRALLRSLSPELLVVDDPSAADTRRWLRAAAVRQIPVALIQDVGIPGVKIQWSGGPSGPPALLTIDASLRSADADLQGPDFAILDPVVAELRRGQPGRDRKRVVVALGGGTHVRRLGVDVATRIRQLRTDVVVDVAPGFSRAPLPALPDGCRWTDRRMLHPVLATATAAVVSGGVTAYEACALGTPIVTLAVAAAQHATTAALAARGAVIDASADSTPQAVDRTVAAILDLVDRPARRADLTSEAMRLVDGRGAARVSAHIRAFLLAHPRRGARHAA